jgi:hypothetical protein
MIDEDPSPDDIERFAGDTAYCPACGAEVWDQTPVCPECGQTIAGDTLSRPPIEDWLRRRWFVLVAIIALIAFVLLAI